MVQIKGTGPVDFASAASIKCAEAMTMTVFRAQNPTPNPSLLTTPLTDLPPSSPCHLLHPSCTLLAPFQYPEFASGLQKNTDSKVMCLYYVLLIAITACITSLRKNMSSYQLMSWGVV